MEKILISPCLLGDNVKWNGGNNYYPFVEKLKKKFQLVPFCTEIEAGLPTPRVPAEIRNSSVINKDGKDLTSLYVKAANNAVQICKLLGIRIAILKDGSPACGSRMIYNGKFEGIKIEGLGVTARALINAGIKVYSETDNLEFLLGNPGKEKATLKKNIEKQKEKEAEKARTRKKKLPVEEGEETPRRGRKPMGKRPYSKDGQDKNEYGHFEKRKGEGKKPYGSRGEKKSFGKGPRGDKKFDKPRRPFGEKPMGDGGEKRGYGKKSYGPKKSYGGKKSFGGKPGEKKPYSQRKKSFGGKPGARKSYSGRKPFKKGE